MLVGVLSGAAAAIVAALLSLPLHSPDDVFFNTATVTVGALLAGLVAGGLHAMLSPRWFVITWSAAFVLVAAALVAGESMFERMLAFGLPLAVVVFGITGLGVLFLHLRAIRRIILVTATAAAAGAAVAVGLGLSGYGDGESGSLSLPATAASNGANGAPARFATRATLKNVTFVVGDGSRASFAVREQVAQIPLPNEAVMRSTALAGDIHLDGRPSRITLDLQALTSEQARRDSVVQQHFRAHPAAVFTVPLLDALPERYEPGQAVKQTVKGTLAINGVERPITFEVEARIDDAVLSVLGKTTFVWKDFDLSPPSSPTAKVLSEVTVEVLLAARAQPG